MSENVISVLSSTSPAGMTPGQFRRIDGIYCLAASQKVLGYRAVNCDFDEGVMMIALSKTEQHPAYLSFVSRKVGPKTTMYELYKEGKGRIEKSALFDRVFDRYRQEVETLFDRDV